MEEKTTQTIVETSKHEILEAIQLFSNSVDKQFGVVNKQFGEVNKQFGEVNKQFDGVKNELKTLENKMDEGFASVRSELADVKSDLLERINRLDDTTKQDTDVIVRDYLDIKIRVKKLEQQVQQLQPA